MTDNDEVNAKLALIGKNYAASSREGGCPLEELRGFPTEFGKIESCSKHQIPRFSCGHRDHIWTSHSARPFIFQDLESLEKQYAVEADAAKNDAGV